MKKIFFSLSLFSVLLPEIRAQVPIMNPLAGPDTVCSDPSAPMSFSASANNSPTQFHWSVSPSSGVVFSSYNAAVVQVTFPQGPGSYSLFCYASNFSGNGPVISKHVLVLETPSVTFSGAHTAFCQGSSTTLMASATTFAASSTLIYNWKPSAGLSSTNSFSTVANPSVSTNYTVVVSLGVCSTTVQVPITIHPAPAISVFSNNNPMCEGEIATITLGGSGVTYSVNGAPTPITFTVAPSGNTSYLVSALSLDGCESQTSFAQSVSKCLAVQKLQQELNTLLVFPNPSSGEVRMKAGRDLKVVISNQLGAMVRRMDLKAGEETRLTELEPGVYFIQSGTVTSRLIITR
jgi:hypothetical protein